MDGYAQVDDAAFGRRVRRPCAAPESICPSLHARRRASLFEVAEVLGTTVTVVKLRAHRAYEAFRDAVL